MEIFQNFWNVLTIQNIILSNILSFPFLFIHVLFTLLLLVVTLSFLAYFLYQIMQHGNPHIPSPNLISNFAAIIAITTFATSIQIGIYVLYQNIISPYVTLLNISILLFYFLLHLYHTIQMDTLGQTKQILDQTKETLEQSEYCNKTLTTLNDKIRCLNHDFSNILTIIGGYIQSNDLDGLKKYYLQLRGDCQSINNLSILSPTVINNAGVYRLLSNKYYLAEEKGITMNFDVFLDLNDLHMKIYEFARILRYFNG